MRQHTSDALVMTRRDWSALFDEAFLLRLQRLQLLAKTMASGLSVGTRRSKQLGDGLEFADHRAYSPGDDVRFIDWPYYARMEKLLLRLFHQHSQADVVLLLDCSGSMAAGGEQFKFYYAIRAAAALAYVAMASFERVILQPFAEELQRPLKTGRSAAQILQVLGFLADLRVSGRTRLRGCIEQFARQNSAPTTLLLITDLTDCFEDLSSSLGLLKQRTCDVTVIHVYCPSEVSPGLLGPTILRCVESGVQMRVEVTEPALESYRRRWAAFQASCERACGSLGATYVAAPTDRPFEKLILQTLRSAGVLAG